ncbi:hypothetical protein KsCSTR_44020 [Candidatus Kuenenia stuttgartiensis]|uniref:Uncharacterized protein n=1 Tax=Kuenenia stuttgartiensis TaxID=174633 RepID=Q1PWR0_KUEST|nr:hypothetical protein KsCSTR_44020 [Candidatus Kuenenia stuttgartiensis]CAJ71668.1 unknown protein [Candidatus Kuenenia stuttgartiensis]
MSYGVFTNGGAFPIFCNRLLGQDDITLTGFRTLSALTLRQYFIKTWRKSQKIRNAPL